MLNPDEEISCKFQRAVDIRLVDVVDFVPVISVAGYSRRCNRTDRHCWFANSRPYYDMIVGGLAASLLTKHGRLHSLT